MSWYLQALKKYAVFSGRSRRMEYWYFVLFNIIVSIVLGTIDALLGTLGSGMGVGLLSGIYSLAVLIPSLAVTVRRLHDIDRSGLVLPRFGPNGLTLSATMHDAICLSFSHPSWRELLRTPLRRSSQHSNSTHLGE